MAERIAKLATMAMIAVCPQLNPIPVPTRKKPNSDQPAYMIHLVWSMGHADPRPLGGNLDLVSSPRANVPATELKVLIGISREGIEPGA